MKKQNLEIIGKENARQPQFYQKVYEIVARIPKGKVSTYVAIANACSCPRGSRAVGNALRCNKDTWKVPCHRVVKSDFSLGGYAGGVEKKKKMLIEEGIVIRNGKIQNPADVFFDPKFTK